MMAIDFSPPMNNRAIQWGFERAVGYVLHVRRTSKAFERNVA